MMKKRKLIGPLFWACVLAAVCLYAFVSLSAIPSHFQYLWTPEKNVTQSGSGDSATKTTSYGLKEARQKLEDLSTQFEGAIDRYTLFGIGQAVSIGVKDGASTTARMEALLDGAYALKPLLLYTGRLIYPEEFERGDRVVMVDEQLAVKLFQYAEPVDREVVLGGKSYTIVGIVRDQKRVGDYQDYSFYVPYRAIEKAGEPVDALCLEATPVPGAGGWAAFQTGVATLAGGGNTISLTKEKMNATLPLRVLLCCIGIAISFCGISALNRRAKGVYLRYRERLVVTYAIRLTPWIIGQALLLAAGYALALLLLAQVFVQLIAPVYTFPEWVPAILVEPKDIAAAFWNCWQPVATLRELRSPEALRIRFFGMLMGWCCAALAAILMLGWKRAVTPPEELPKE